MPCCWSSAPRKKLPPPVTIATCTPERCTVAISWAMPRTTSGSTPTLPPPKTSPDSFSRTRSYPVIRFPSCGDRVGSRDTDARGSLGATYLSAPPRRERRPWSTQSTGGRHDVVVPASCAEALLRAVRSGADLEAGEALDLDAGSVEDGLDRLLAVRDRRLVEEHDLLVEAVEPALGDLG